MHATIFLSTGFSGKNIYILIIRETISIVYSTIALSVSMETGNVRHDSPFALFSLLIQALIGRYPYGNSPSSDTVFQKSTFVTEHFPQDNHFTSLPVEFSYMNH